MKKLYILLLFHYIVIAQTTPYQMVERMGTGINLGNILSAPYEGNWADPLTESYVDNVARLRFKHVRIPIRFDNQTTPFSSVNYSDNNGNYIGSPANYSVNVAYLNRIEEILDWCLARNLVVIIDVHGDHWFWESYDEMSTHYKIGNDRLAAIDRFKAIWRDISVRFQNKPDDVLFEIMNEPFFSMNPQEVIDVNTIMLGVIRQTNPTRNVIVTGGGMNSYQAPLQLSDTFIASDNHLIATYHYYQPFSFTSSASQQYTDNDWGTTTDMNTITNHFNQVQTWSIAKNIPVYMGEFGADNVNGYNYSTNTNGLYGGPDVNSRFLYHQFLAQAARSRGFALAVWDAGEESGKTLYLTTPQSWVKDIRNGVLGSNCSNEEFINNANIECNYDYSWTSTTSSGYSVKLYNSTKTDGYLNSVSLQANVSSSQGVFTGAVISNSTFTTGFTIGQNYTISFKAKGDNNQQFRVRVKRVATNGNTSYTTSATLNLNGIYNNFTYSYTVPTNTTSITFEILCGKNTGNYFFDEFSIQNGTLKREEFFENNVAIYPNPVSDIINIEYLNEGKIDGIYNSLGQKMENFKMEKNKIILDSFQNGIYFLVINNDLNYKTIKFIVNN